MNMPVYLGLLIQDISKTIICDFWYDYTKVKHGDKEKICYTDAESFIVHVKLKDIYEKYNVEKLLPIRKNKK